MTPTQSAPPIPGAKLIRGVWFPPHDKHLSDMVQNRSKIGEVTLKDGRKVGTYQFHKWWFAQKYLPSGRRRIAVDVGGHIGLWSMHLADTFEHVVAFEPLPVHWQLFEANVLQQNVTLHKVALGDKTATTQLFVDPLNTGNTHSIGKDHDRLEETMHAERRRVGIDETSDIAFKIVEVPIARLDDFHLDNVDLIKIDVEGFELPVVMGAVETIKRCKPLMIVEQKSNDVKFRGEQRNAAGRFLVETCGMRLLKDYGGDWILIW